MLPARPTNLHAEAFPTTDLMPEGAKAKHLNPTATTSVHQEPYPSLPEGATPKYIIFDQQIESLSRSVSQLSLEYDRSQNPEATPECVSHRWQSFPNTVPRVLVVGNPAETNENIASPPGTRSRSSSADLPPRQRSSASHVSNPDHTRPVPMVSVLTYDSDCPKITEFSGSLDSDWHFAMWIRRLEDIMNMKNSTMTSKQKSFFLIGHLAGVAREKVDEMDEADRKVFDKVVSHLRSYFEGPQQKHLARQALIACKQTTEEPSASFANRILHLVRIATAGQDPSAQKERVLEELLARLRPDIRYHVKLDNPSTFEQAVAKAQMVELLLSEATASCLKKSTAIGEVKALQTEPRRTSSPMHSRQKYNVRVITCYNCQSKGHIAAVCPFHSRRTRFSDLRPKATQHENSGSGHGDSDDHRDGAGTTSHNKDSSAYRSIYSALNQGRPQVLAFEHSQNNRACQDIVERVTSKIEAKMEQIIGRALGNLEARISALEERL